MPMSDSTIRTAEPANNPRRLFDGGGYSVADTGWAVFPEYGVQQSAGT
ncbi:MAG: hypothetical protein HIU89_12595 [Proteobacteria bacterium]|nr:hypothetical protein [Pseudomonadota bacterium]